jgi:hypothetical protein
MILDLSKTHTIRRRRRKRQTVVGDSLMLYIGLRTKQAFMFAYSVCSKVEPIIIYPMIQKIMMDGKVMRKKDVEKLAKDDGFESTGKFFEFFENTYGEYELADFEIIHWDTSKLVVFREAGNG